jgi:integrase
MGEAYSPIFLASYLEAENKEPAHKDGDSFSSLLLKYQGSADFKGLKPNTKRLYHAYILALRERYGSMSLKAMEHKGIRTEFLDWRDKLIAQGKAATARNLLKFSQTLFQWGEERNILDVNRLRGMKQLYRSNRSENTWEPAAIGMILSGARPIVGHAIRLALWSGQRQGDLCKAKWSDIKNEALIVEQQKTGAIVGLPLIGGFRLFLDSLPKESAYILNSSLGTPWEESSLRQAWSGAVAGCGQDKTGNRFHDLRGTTITTLADMGASEAQIASISGHAYGGQAPTLRTYLRKTHVQARAAMEKLDESWIGSLAN